MPRRLSQARALTLATLLATLPSAAPSHPYGPGSYGGGWRVPYGAPHPAYWGYSYRPYYGYGYGYRPYYGAYYGYPYWGFLGAMLGAIIVRPPPVYVYPPPAPVMAAPPVQQCPDGSTVPLGSHCAAPVQAPAPALPAPQPAPERG